MSDFGVPDVAGIVVGCRAWEIRRGPILASVVHSAVWDPRKPFEATCAERHPVPDPDCSCGIYAAATREDLGEFAYGDYDLAAYRVVVVGEVSLWGGVIPGEQGWRAQFAYPRRLFVPYECWRLAEPLREDYGVKVTLSNTYRLLEA